MKTIIELWQQSQNDAEGMRLGYTTQQHYFAALVRADEREACAAQLDFNAQAASNGGDEYIAALLWQEAEEIRARGNK